MALGREKLRQIHHRTRSFRLMRTGVLGCGAAGRSARSMALISRSSSRTLGRSPLARTRSAHGAGEILGELLLLAEGGADGGAVLRVEREGEFSGSAGGGGGWVKPRS